MPVNAVSSTTLSAAIDARQTRFAVASTTGINGTGSLSSPQSIIVIGIEAMLVQSVPVAGVLEVVRGVNGTKAPASGHPSGAKVFYGAKTIFGFNEDGFVGLSATPGAGLPNYRLPLGTRRVDGYGREFVLCDFNSTVYPEQPVSISGGFIADALATSGRGNIGVVAETGLSTSDQWGWVQIYGRCFVQLGMSGASPSDDAAGPTSLSTSKATVFFLGTSLTSPNGIGWNTSDASGYVPAYVIDGMTVAEDASVSNEVSAVTSGNGVLGGASGHTGGHVAVFLNYPRIRYQLDIVSGSI